MKQIVLLAVLLMWGCGSDEAPLSEDVDALRDDFGSQLDAEKAAQDSKSDEPQACGDDQCIAQLCGYDCTQEDSQCERACAQEDTRPSTFVKLTVTGGTEQEVDSTDYDYDPVLRLKDVLIYGCQLWDFSAGHRDTLDVSYDEIVSAPLTVGEQQTDAGKRARVSIKTYLGPGSYVGEGFFAASSRAHREGDYWYDAEGCGIEVSETSDGGLRGDVSCDIAHKSGGAPIQMSGEFECGINSMRPRFVGLSGN